VVDWYVYKQELYFY